MLEVLNQGLTRIELKTYVEDSRVVSTFNVMPDKPVEEVFFIKEYRLKPMYGEATFDREYSSSMLNSPNHLIFITGLIHTQKLLYAVLCETLGKKYDPGQPEVLKIWPTSVSVDMPKMVRKSTDIVQKLTITSLEEITPGKFKVSVTTTYDEIVKIDVESLVYLI